MSVTLDNMGEAYEIESGSWPADGPVGKHLSVTRALPVMLDSLDAHGLKATYFIESWNTDVYPEAIAQVAGRGHEIASHGFRHEPWAGIPGA